MPRILGYGALFSVVLAVYEYTGASIKGSRKSQELDEFERKEAMRKNRRRPLSETLAEVGEGRCELSRRERQCHELTCVQLSIRLDTRSGGASV
jgi:hypothetical protein